MFARSAHRWVTFHLGCYYLSLSVHMQSGHDCVMMLTTIHTAGVSAVLEMQLVKSDEIILMKSLTSCVMRRYIVASMSTKTNQGSWPGVRRKSHHSIVRKQ